MAWEICDNIDGCLTKQDTTWTTYEYTEDHVMLDNTNQTGYKAICFKFK